MPGSVSRRAMVAALAASTVPRVAAAPDLVRLAASAKRSVCSVGTFSPLDNPRFTFRGTGFFVGSGNTVVTCWHVLPQARPGDAVGGRLVVQLATGDGTFEHRDADVTASDRLHDLAVLRIAGPAQPTLAVAEPENVQEGANVVFVGFPIGGVLGFSPVIHRGIVSSLVSSSAPPPTAQRLTPGAVRQAREGAFVLVQLDATAYPGNSGGPLLDVESGQVVGVISMVLLKGTRESALSNPSGISYAVPARYLSPLLTAR